ncbi:MAG: exosortase/archaeosortase family protein [Chthoniobacterales bacterium]
MSEVAATFSDSVRKAGDWIRKNPAQAFLLAAIAATFVYFYGFLRLYAGLPIGAWAWLRYLPAYNQEHSKLVPFAFLFLVWYHRQALVAARKEGSNWGLLLIGLGVLLYVVAARALQARLAIAALPFLFSGVLLFVWGREVARILLFPSLFLLFLVPLGAIEQMTFRLQFLITGAVQWLSGIFGIKIYAVGTTLRAVDGSWGFDIAEGCSGIRSLIAMVMITSIYVHIVEKELWKKATIFILSVLFAIIGNAGRIFTIIIIAKLGFPEFAGGLYHEYSGFVFFPIALGAMLLTSKLLNLRAGDVRAKAATLTEKETRTYDY